LSNETGEYRLSLYLITAWQTKSHL